MDVEPFEAHLPAWCTMIMTAAADLGREAFEKKAWKDACAHLSSADEASPLEPGNIERLAIATYLIGGNADELWARSHHEFLRRGDTPRAVRCAFWLAFVLLNRGDRAVGGGWIARARRLLDDGRHDCVEHGYLLVPAALERISAGDASAALDIFAQADAVGDRFGDPDLVTLARHGRGRALIRLGETAAGVALLDEIMVAVTADEVSPVVAGVVYCSVIDACQEMYDVRRAREWTAAFSRWCASQPDLIPYRGVCLVNRVEILQLYGAWNDAVDEACRACEWLSDAPDEPVIGAALYRQAELHRLRGELAKAEEVYREASRCARKPQPGLALLRLAQGRVAEAAATSRRVLDESSTARARAAVLPAHVEVMLASGDVQAARNAAAELSEIAERIDAPMLRALAGDAIGAVQLAEGEPGAALASLRLALASWRELEAPYEAARDRVLIGLACRALGDEDGAGLELEAARAVFEQLGAAPDLARLEQLRRPEDAPAAGTLTGREIQVLRLLATGRTNRAIAADLSISEKTVARHVSNIFTKVGVTSRAAATAYAFRNGLA